MPRDNKGRFVSSNMSSQNRSNTRSGGHHPQDIHEKRTRTSDGQTQQQQQQGSPSHSPLRKKSNISPEDIDPSQVNGSSPDDLLYPHYMKNPSHPSSREFIQNSSLESVKHQQEPYTPENHPVNTCQGINARRDLPNNSSQTMQPYHNGNQSLGLPPTGFQGQGNLIVLANSQGMPISSINLEDVLSRVMSGVMCKLDSMSEDLKQVAINKEDTEKLKTEMSKVKTDFSGIDKSVKDLQDKEKEAANNQRAIVHELNSIKDRIQHPSPQTSNSPSPQAELENLISQAVAKKNNLIIEGLSESEADPVPEEEALTKVTTFFSESFGLKDMDIDSAFRLGKVRQGSRYPRPILVRFMRPRERDAVWYARTKLARMDDNKRVNIKEDLPPKLRIQLSALIKVSQVARRYPDSFQNVFIKDFKIFVNGISYYAHQLELLPTKLRPSEFSTPGNVDAVAFYTRSSPFSNHYQSRFVWDGREFSSVEQYLAFRRASLANRRDLAKLAMDSNDPADAKKIMNELRSASSEPKWIENRHDILYCGLLAKFSQRQDLMRYLLDSENRQLGEASRDLDWGIGLTLMDQHVLSPPHWKGKNLLGKTLMEVRQELSFPHLPDTQKSRKSPNAEPTHQAKRDSSGSKSAENI